MIYIYIFFFWYLALHTHTFFYNVSFFYRRFDNDKIFVFFLTYTEYIYNIYEKKEINLKVIKAMEAFFFKLKNFLLF